MLGVMASYSTPDSDGIDVSHWNVITDWDAIPDFDLWCMKATEGKGFRSPVFDSRWKEIRDRGVQYRGAYHWIRSDSSMEAQVNNLARAISDHGGLHQGEFIMLDWETTPGIRSVYTSEVEEWLDLAEKLWPGRIIVYASDWVPGFKTWRKANPDYPLWYANYRLVRDDRGGEAESDLWGADVWQWTSTELVPGYRDGIDMNDVLNWDVIAEISGYSKTPEPAPEPSLPAPKVEDRPNLRPTPARTEQNKQLVMDLQTVLKLKAGQRVTVDGWYGPETELAVRNVQKFFGLTVDGWVGPQTYKVIDFLASL